MTPITKDNLHLLGASSVNCDKFLAALNDTLIRYEINTPLRICHFLAQVFHESAYLSVLRENLNYSAVGLVTTFPHYFPNIELANGYTHQPQKIANRVYANRMGNGNEISDDGFNFRGGGTLQITGKENYIEVGKRIGYDLGAHPEFIVIPNIACLAAGDFWNEHSLNHLADVDNIKAITRLINGGYTHLAERTELLNKAKTIFVE